MWAPRTLWRVGRHALLAVASTWSEESLSLSLTCRSFLGGPRAFLSSPLLFTPSCRALPERCAPPKLLARNALSCDAACSIHITQSAVEVPVAPRLSTFRLTAPGSRQPASAAAYTAYMSIIKYDLNCRFFYKITTLYKAQ